MKIVGTGQSGPRGDDLAVFIGSNELVNIIALLRRARDTVRHTENWEFSPYLQHNDRAKLDLLADALVEVAHGDWRGQGGVKVLELDREELNR